MSETQTAAAVSEHTSGKLILGGNARTLWGSVNGSQTQVSEASQMPCIGDGSNRDLAAERGARMEYANARRLCAAWNEFDGLTTEQIEDGAFTKMRADRDALLVIVRKYLHSAEAPMGMALIADIDTEARALLEARK